MLFTFRSHKSKLQLNISSMDFWFEFLNIHMNEKKKKLATITMALNDKI